jgi:hypothetical protein
MVRGIETRSHITGKAMPDLADMSVVTQLAISWAIAAGAAVFLILCARYNRDVYPKKQPVRSGVEDALNWLMEFRESLSPEPDATATAVPPGSPSMVRQKDPVGCST